LNVGGHQHDRMISRLAGLLMIALFCVTAPVHAESPSRQHLFKIERSKNANIVQYDVQVNADGSLFRKEPVVAYWIRLAQQGQVEELSWVQRVFAFGFEATFKPETGNVELKMNADVDRLITILNDGEKYRARGLIDGSDAYIERVYIRSNRKGLFFDVEYIELFGEDVDTAGPRYEKLIMDPD
jgi:hypothetical protein